MRVAAVMPGPGAAPCGANTVLRLRRRHGILASLVRREELATLQADVLIRPPVVPSLPERPFHLRTACSTGSCACFLKSLSVSGGARILGNRQADEPHLTSTCVRNALLPRRFRPMC